MNSRTLAERTAHAKADHPPGLSPLLRVQGYGMATESRSYYCEPRSVAEIKEILAYARRRGLTVGLRGTGCSYGDASINEGGVVLSCAKMNRILDWDPETGVLHAEAGVTIEQAWKTGIPDHYWVPVVSGTMFPTLAGAASMNIHGKNAWKAGTLSDYILELTMMLPSGELVRCSRTEEPELFRAALGGFGMLGIITEVKLKLKKVPGGRLRVYGLCAPNLRDLITEFERLAPTSDYLVGWIDFFAKGDALGRSIIHAANFVGPEEDPLALESFAVEKQVVPAKIAGLVPMTVLGDGLRLFAHDPGMRLVNWGKYWSTRLLGDRKSYYQSHGAYHFLLDYIPNWKNIYKPGGFIQYQTFVPFTDAERTLRRLWVTCHKRGVTPWLGVFKRHKDDPYLMTHAVDGYSVAMDIGVQEHNRAKVWDLSHELDEILIAAGGRLYFAKDATMRPEILERMYRPERVAAFRKMKERCDPEGILQTNLSRRIGVSRPGLSAAAAPARAARKPAKKKK